MKLKYLNIKNINTVFHFVLNKETNKKNILKQTIDLIKLWKITGYIPYNYYKYGNAWKKGGNVSTIAKYIPGRLFDEIREETLNENSFNCLLDNKSIFNRWLNLHHIKTTEQVKFWPATHKIHTEELHYLFDIFGEYVLKPAKDSTQGKGVTIIDSHSIINDNLSSNLNSLKISYIAEKKLQQHHILADLYPHSINTIRIDTLKDINQRVHIINAMLRVGRNGRKVDNWSGNHGGIAIGLDLEKGALECLGVDYHLNTYTKHPDTNISFGGIAIPYWSTLIETTRRAAGIFPELSSVGWDIALTIDGPVFIEGNSDYGIRSIQVACGPYGDHRLFCETIMEHMAEQKKINKSFVKIANFSS
jgi:hypothetical protein